MARALRNLWKMEQCRLRLARQAPFTKIPITQHRSVNRAKMYSKREEVEKEEVEEVPPSSPEEDMLGSASTGRGRR